MKLSSIALVGALAACAVAHERPSTGIMKRHADLSKRCSTGAANLNRRRYERRSQMKRDLDLEKRSGNTTYEIVTEAPYYEVLQNDTCVLTPDVTSGPYYWPRSQTLRQDMSEDQIGVPLVLDIGVLDMAKCEPLPNALVSLWHCNATGSYSSFTGRSPNTPFVQLLNQLNISEGEFKIGTTDLHTDDTTWLRGMWPTNDEGMLEMRTIFPGFYVERTIHIHTQVFTDYVLHSNGTISTGNLNSIGQLYFNESISQELMALAPYVSHVEINRTTNDVDSIYEAGLAGAYNPDIEVVPLDGEDIRNGVLGYITIGVDTSNLLDLNGN